jgi:pre-rRNA-processing protein TSR4
MVLLLQLNGELPDRFLGHERRLYVFTCRQKKCRRKEGSIRAVRGVRVADGAGKTAARDDKIAREEVAPVAAKPTPGLGDQIFGKSTFGSGTNPFATSGSGQNPFATGGAAKNPFSTANGQAGASEARPAESKLSELPKTFASALSLNSIPNNQPAGPPRPPEPWPPESEQPQPYPISYLSEADYETLDPEPPPKVPATSTAMDLDPSSAAEGSSSGKEDKEVFESSMDSVFQKFADRLAQNPEQCIRYEFGGQPLLYSKSGAVGKMLYQHTSSELAASGSAGKVSVAKGMPRCPNCGAGRVFEVQLTPHAIEELESEEDGLDGMDWGTVIIGVCERDCQERTARSGEVSYLEEWVGVQWEELTVRR